MRDGEQRLIGIPRATIRALSFKKRFTWRLGGEPIAASLFDFGYLFHNARALMEPGSGPYFYLPKLESHLEARLWNDSSSRRRPARDPAGHDPARRC